MPPFITVKCTNPKCRKPNRFDLPELRKKDGSILKKMAPLVIQTEEEFEVTCQYCGRKFKFSTKGLNDGE